MSNYLIMRLLALTLCFYMVLMPMTVWSYDLGLNDVFANYSESDQSVNLLIKKSKIQSLINSELSKTPKRQKSTDFNKLDVYDWSTVCTNKGVRIRLSWRAQHRELIASVLGKRHYTPWVSISGNVDADFSVSINDGVSRVLYEGHKITTTSGGVLKPIFEDIIDNFTRNNIIKTIISHTRNINGVPIKDVFIDKTSQTVAMSLNLHEDKVKSELRKVNINGYINEDGLTLTAKYLKEFRAIVVAWSSNGGAVVSKRKSVSEARQKALDKCNQAYKNCDISGTIVYPFEYACLAIAKSGRSFLAASKSSKGREVAKEEALNACYKKYGNNCRIVSLKCND